MPSLTWQKHELRVQIRERLEHILDADPDRARGMAIAYARILMGRMTIKELREWQAQLDGDKV